jgi:uncharacterized delta-60 repeat protein
VARDGSIAAAGDARDLGFAVARYTRDGLPDTTFDADGKLTTAFTNNTADARTIAIRPDGKAVVAGTEDPDTTTQGNREGRFVIARYNRNGTPDTAFGGGDGLVSTMIDGSEVALDDVAVQRDGRIVAAGNYRGDLLDGPVFARFNPDGSLDTTFAGDGTSAPDLAPPDEGGREYEADFDRVALDRSGLIYAVGRLRTRFPDATEKFEPAVARLGRTGTADEAWGLRGLMRRGVTDSPTADDRATSIAVGRSGRMVVGGHAGVDGGPADAFIGRVVFDRVGGTARLSGNGTLTIRGTRGPDFLRTNLPPVQTGELLLVRINDRPAQAFDLVLVRRIVVLAGDGNDRVTLFSDAADDNTFPIRAGGKPALIDGGRGNDVLVGEDAIDSIKGGAGDDTLTGRLGADLLNGGSGTDVATTDDTDRLLGIETPQPAA